MVTKDDMLTRIAMALAARQRKTGKPAWEFLGAEAQSEYQMMAFDALKELEKPSAIMIAAGNNVIMEELPEGVEVGDDVAAFCFSNMILAALQ